MSGATRYLWASRLRRSLRRVVVLAVLTALGGGMALAVAAGARRTDRAYEAVVDLTDGAELGSSYVPQDLDRVRDRIRTVRGVGDIFQAVGFLVLLPETPVAGLTSLAYNEDPVVVERPIVLEGRMPHAADEVFLNEAGAAAVGVAVGDRVPITIANPDFTEFAPHTVVVVGVGLLANEVYQDETGAAPTLIFAKDFIEGRRDLVAWGAVAVRVAPGADRADVIAQMLVQGFTIDNDRDNDRDQAQAAIVPLVVTLWVLALLTGLATVVVVGQAVSRLMQQSDGDARSLAAMGCSRGMRVVADLGLALIVLSAGVIGAVGVAVMASPLFPQGRARRVPELQGFDIDVATLALGAVVLLVALAGIVGAASLRIGPGAARPGAAPGLLGAHPAVSTGVRLATGRRGLLAAVGSVAVGLTTIVAGVTFTGSMDNLVARPELAGFSWDLLGRDAYAQIDYEAVAGRLHDEVDVRRITGLTFADVTVDATPLPASVWAEIKGSPWPSLSGGRTPAAPNEVLFSEKTLEDLGYEIGDAVTIGFAGEDNEEHVVVEIEMTVVGTAVSPAIGLAGTDTPRLDEGVLIRQADIAGLHVEYGSAVLFDLADGADPDTIKAQFPEGLPDDVDAVTEWFLTAQPAEVIQAGAAVDVLVLAIAALLIWVTATVGHNLLSLTHQQRNAFAVLKVIGFTSRQLLATVLSHSALVVGAALVVALPLGMAAGRWLYRGFAASIGVIVRPTVPVLALSAVVTATIVLVQAVALVPARQARSTHAAAELRGE